MHRAFLLALAPFMTVCSYVGVAPTPPPPDADDLWIHNSTSIPVQLIVNGTVLRTVSPGAQDSVAPAQLPARPWSVETRTTSGRTLSAMTVRAGDVRSTILPYGGTELRGDAVRVDLSCGRLDVWIGPPLLGPSPGPGKPGDCDP